MTERLYRVFMAPDCLAAVTLTLAVTGVPLRLWTLARGAPSTMPAVPVALALMSGVFVAQTWAASAGNARALRWIAATGLFGAGWLATAQLVTAPAFGNWWYWVGVIPVQAWLWWRAGERMRADA
jgi:hypothetical protein